MLLAALVFVVTAGFVLGGYAAAVKLPPMLEKRRLERRLKEVSEPAPIEASSDSTVVKNYVPGPVPAIDRAIAGSRAGNALAVLIEQSGVRATASGVVLMSIGCAMLFGVCALLFVPLPVVALGAAGAGMWVPVLWLMRCRSVRLRRFEEQFPEGLDLMSRAIRAGHAFQTALGMVGEELPAPVGSEFKKTFDRQNFGLPLRDAMNEMADRIPILDVRFFVTAVAIQRETGGNLAEILDNLAHVVRERFKIRRQVRVHTAHGRFTGYVLLALPAALAVALSFIAPETMSLLFRERMGQMMLVGAIGMQTIGFFWIRQVIKIEV